MCSPRRWYTGETFYGGGKAGVTVASITITGGSAATVKNVLAGKGSTTESATNANDAFEEINNDLQGGAQEDNYLVKVNKINKDVNNVDGSANLDEFSASSSEELGDTMAEGFGEIGELP